MVVYPYVVVLILYVCLMSSPLLWKDFWVL